MHHIGYYDIEADAAQAVDDWLWKNYREGPENFDAEGNRIVRQSTDSSIYRGVSWHKRDRKWAARIKVDQKTENLGNFDTPKGGRAVPCGPCSLTLAGAGGRARRPCRERRPGGRVDG